MKKQLEKVEEKTLRQIESFEALGRLNDIRIPYLGEKGELTSPLKSMKDVAPEGRPKVGQMVNDVRGLIRGRLEKAKAVLTRKARKEQLKGKAIDVTLPARRNNVGHSHPNTIALGEMEHISVGTGYEIVEGPEVEYDKYNFEKLSIPKGHPVRDRQDTSCVSENILLRSQASPVRVRTMEEGRLPIHMIAPGRVFRSDEVDITHSLSFRQIGGLMIDKNITFADLRGTLAEFVRELFGPETKVKFHPHHFPFTGPSAEVDMIRFKYGGSGCRFCRGSGWIEILGCGMIHPHTLEMCGIDPDEYSGFALGVGLERIALLKYEIDDIRLLHENDIRFLKQL